MSGTPSPQTQQAIAQMNQNAADATAMTAAASEIQTKIGVAQTLAQVVAGGRQAYTAASRF